MNRILRAIVVALFFIGGFSRAHAAEVYNESGGLVVMEMEGTGSSLGLWQANSSLSGYTGSGYLQFFGNSYESGPAQSPLEYTFKINQGGLYYLHMHCAKEIHDGRNDVANDAYVRVEGDFNAGPGPYSSHGNNASLALLSSNTKYYGGAVNSWKWEDGKNNLDPGGHSNKRNALYDFKAGETYKLVVSGRSKFFRINRLMFRHTSVPVSSAQNLSNPESELVTPAAEYTYGATTDFAAIDGGDVPYYKDNGNNALAIAANVLENRTGFARASRTFDGTSGSYDVTLTTLTEEDGESTYRLLVNGSVVASFENTYIGPDSPQDLQPETHMWVGISIDNGDTISIESNADTNGEIPENGGTAWARGRWRQVELSSSLIKPPAGRLAYVADGNSPDPDDIGANAVVFGLLSGTDTQNRLVHFSHSCDLVKASNIPSAAELRRQNYLHQTAGEGIAHFGPFEHLADYYNCRSNQTAAVANLTMAINASTAADPLWIIEAGEPDIIGYALQAANASAIPHVHVVSHHPANDNSGDFFLWADILAFGVTEHQIGDQNVGLQVQITSGLWDWAEIHSNPAMVWILDQLKYAEADGVVGFQSGKYDCSDAGMIYWWLTGAHNGGDKLATPVDIKDMLLYDGSTAPVERTVTMVTLGSAADLTAGSTWSDGEGAHSGADYIVPATGNLRGANGTSTFPGDSLTVLAGGKFQVRAKGSLGEVSTVDSLVFTNGTSFSAGEFAQLAAGTGNDLANVLAGSIVNSGYTKFLAYHAFSGGTISRSLQVQSTIDGEGSIQASEGSTGFGGEQVIISNAENTFSGIWEVGTGTTLQFSNAGAVGAADIHVLDSGKLRILGDWSEYATLTVADSAETGVDLGAYNWTVVRLEFGGTAVPNQVYTAAELNALGGNAVFSGTGTITVSPPPAPALIAGWDRWNSASSPTASVAAPNMTATAVVTTEQVAWNTTDERGASNDGTWGTQAGPPAASMAVVDGENLTLQNASTGGAITFTLANDGSTDVVLDAFHFDAYAFRPKAPRTYALSVLPGGGVSAGVVFTSANDAITSVGGRNANDAHDSIDLTLTGLADHTLAAGESAQFRLAFSSGVGDGAGGHHLFVDNVAFTQIPTAPPVGVPLVNAGPDVVVNLPENQADLLGSATDDGTIVSYLWAQLAGPSSASLTGENTATLSIGDLLEGTYSFRLSAADDEGNVSSDDVTVTVTPDHSDFARVTSFTLINAETDQPIFGFDPITSGSTLNKATVGTTVFNIRVNTSPAYDFGSVVMALSGATTKNTTESNPVWALFGDTAGDFKPGALNDGAHTLTATPYNADSGGGDAGTSLTINFNVINQAGAPLANAGADQVVNVPASEVTLNGSGTDDVGIASYVWAQISGPNTATLANENTADLTASELVEGTYVFRLTVMDDEGNESSDDVNVSVVTPGSGSVIIGGELKQWHKVTLMMDGPSTSETATPNPFTDYRMNVTFTHPASGLSYVVPGYFAADGSAADTSATSGNKWAAHLSPDHAGLWNYTVSFRTGSDVALASDAAAGAAVVPYHNTSGSFTVSETDKTGRDHRAKGRLTYVGKHHLQYAGTGEYFLKAGADAPENLLAYNDVDDTPNDMKNQPNLRKTWSPHAADYDAADAVAYTWNGGKGSELLGAIKYLSDKGVNVFSFLTFSLDGDDDNVFPHLLKGSVADYESVADNARWADASKGVHHDRFDVSKMAQWEKIFEYGDKKGMYLHFKTQETENDQRMDGGALGRERKIYYRELVARYGHHLALNWNLGEENTNTETQEKAFAQWFHENDPYRHNVVLHTYPTAKVAKYTPLLGAASKLTGLSLQTNQEDFSLVFPHTLEWVQKSANAGKPWVVAIDEPGDAGHALRPAGDEGNSWVDGRINAMWGNIMAGGAGVEFYFGYQHANSDLNLQDFRSRDGFWNYCRHMLEFFRSFDVPFWEMANQDVLVSNANAWCLQKPGDTYVVYLKNGGTTTLDLSGTSREFQVRWFDPRNGGSLQHGSVTEVTGGSTVSLGTAPSNATSDWVVLVQMPTPANMQAMYLQWTVDQGMSAAEANPSLDLDGDGFNNMEEFLSGHDPRNAASAFAVESIQTVDEAAGEVLIEWVAQLDRIYRVLQADSPGGEYHVVADGIVYPQTSYTMDIGEADAGFLKVDVRLQ